MSLMNCFVAVLCSVFVGQAIGITVTTNGVAYSFDGSPTLTLTVGTPYTFDCSAIPVSVHPFLLRTVPVSGSPCTGSNFYQAGTTETQFDAPHGQNGAGTTEDTFTWTPATAGTVYFACTVHCFGGSITIQDAPTPFSSSAPFSSSSNPTPSSSSDPAFSSSSDPAFSSSSDPTSTSEQASFSSSIKYSSSSAGAFSSSSGVVPSSSAAAACGSTFQITQPSSAARFYMVAGFSDNNPTLQLTIGCTYVFNVDVESTHPLALVTSTDGTTVVTDGIATPQTLPGITNGVITYTPTTATTIYYFCGVHAFYGQIVVSAGEQNSGSQIGGSLIVLAVVALVQKLL